MEKNKLKGSWRRQEDCWLQKKKMKNTIKGEKIHFPLMSKGKSKEIWGDLEEAFKFDEIYGSRDWRNLILCFRHECFHQ
jgi:hypothetical protein